MASEPLLAIDAVHKRFGDRIALDGVSLTVNRGEVLGLLGPNGAGKTTLLRLAVDLLRPDRGAVKLFGAPPSAATLARIGYLPEERGLPPRPRAHEMIEYLAVLRGHTAHDAKEKTRVLLDRVQLSARTQSRIGELSKGNQQKIQLACALVGDPEILLVDEPFSGLDPVNRQLALELFQERVRAGAGLMLSTHQLAQVESLCDRILLINRGTPLLEGAVKEVRARHSDQSLRVRATGDFKSLSCVQRSEDEPLGTVRVWLNEGSTAETFLREALLRGCTFESVEKHAPTIEELFVKLVSAPDAAPVEALLA